MAITLSCTCGKTLRVPENLAGKKGKCPACGAVLEIPTDVPELAPLEAEPVAASSPPPGTLAPQAVAPPPPIAPPLQAVAPPPTAMPQTQFQLPQKLRSPGLPPCWLSLATEGAVIKTDFGLGRVMDAFVEAFAKKLKKRYDVQPGPAPQAAGPSAFVQLVSVDKGNRFLRYFLALFAGKTCFEVQGHVIGTSGQRQDFVLDHKSGIGFFGGSSEGLLKVDAKVVARKIAKMLLKIS